MSDQLYSVQEVSKRLSVSEISIRRWVKNGRLHPLRIGKLLRFTPQEVKRFLLDAFPKRKPDRGDIPQSANGLQSNTDAQPVENVNFGNDSYGHFLGKSRTGDGANS